MIRWLLPLAAALALLGAGGPALAGFDLVLKDGVTIQADTLRRYGNRYEVRSWSGETMMIDASEIVRIRASEDPSSGAAESSSPANRVRSSPEPAGDPTPRREPPSEPAPAPRAAPPPEIDPHMPPPSRGIGGQTLSGPPVRSPTVEESLGTLDSPSEWSKPSIDPTWQPTDAFGR